MSVSMLSSEKQLGLSNNGPLLLPLLLLHITTATTTTTTSTTSTTTSTLHGPTLLISYEIWRQRTLTFFVSKQDSQAALIQIPAYREIEHKDD